MGEFNHEQGNAGMEHQQKSSDCAGKPPIFTNDVSYNYAFGALCSSQHSADFSSLVTIAFLSLSPVFTSGST